MNGLTLRMERIDELAQLETGWLGNSEGKRIATDVLDVIRSLVSSLDKSRLPLPAIFPMADEPGMSLSWRLPAMNITLRVYAVENLELSRFDPRKDPATRRLQRESITFNSVEEMHQTLRYWLNERL